MTTAAKELGEQPAFPCPESIGPNGEICRCDGRGVSKRELFTALAMQGLCSRSWPADKVWEEPFVDYVKRHSVECAEELLEQLARQS